MLAMAAGPSGAAGQEPRAELAQEYYQSFKGDPGRIQGLHLIGPDAGQCVRFEPEGLRITLPFGHAGVRPNTGVVTDFGVRGDFEITVGFEILREPEPEDTPQQTRFTLFAPLDRPGQDRATLSRRVTAAGGTEFFPWLIVRKEASGKDERRGNVIPTEAKTGRLRLVRSGAVLAYYASEGADGHFALLQKYPFGPEDLKDVRVVGSTGGPQASLDVRVTDLHIRAESLPNLPAAALPKPGGKKWLLIALASALAATLALGAWLYARQRRRPGKTPAVVVLVALVGTGLGPGRAAGGPELAQEYYQSFKGSTENSQGFWLIGSDAEHYVKFEPEGLRITLPLGSPKERQIGLATGIAVQGDCEITAGFEILKEPEPADSGVNGTRLSLRVGQQTPGENVVRITRGVRPDGESLFIAWASLWDNVTGKRQNHFKSLPTTAKTGRLRLVRSGSVLSYYVAEEANQDFLLLQQHPFGEEDLKNVSLIGSTSGPKASLDARFTDLRIRAESLPNVSAAALPAALPESGGKRELLIILSLSLAITLALGGWFYVRQRRRAGTPPTPAPIGARRPNPKSRERP